jgi:ATP-dependent DNA helicase DinG
MADVQALKPHSRAVLSAGGLVAQASPGFCEREGQLAMADAVADTITEGGALVVEAGTGTGKTFAYLVPALLSGRRIMVSTATKALQDQLFGRDLPRLLDMLRVPVKVALLKGRANYLCPHRLKLHLHGGVVSDRFVQTVLRKVELWAQGEAHGDLTLMPGLDPRSSVMPYITSTRDNCLGSSCPEWKRCPLQSARRDALAADVVVVNHHLFFADVAVRESGVAELLPRVDVVIFDEAHQLNEIGVLFLGEQLSATQLLDLSRDVLVAGLQHARGLCDWTSRCAALERAVRDLRLLLGDAAYARRLPWVQSRPQGVEEAAWQDAVQVLELALSEVHGDLDTVTELSPDLGRLAERAEAMMAQLKALQAPAQADQVLWMDVGKQWRWVRSPLDCAGVFAGVDARDTPEDSPDEDEFSAQRTHGPRSWVFTSATLGDEPSLRWFCAPLGLQRARVEVVQSPFDHGLQSALWVPPNLPLPSDAGHTRALVQHTLPWVRRLQGRTLFLTTSLRALQAAAQAFRDALADTDVCVLVQNEAPKPLLLSNFAAAAAAGGAVLVASVSFWEGVDLPGDMLQLVVLDKLPFPVPDDPVLKARARRIETHGGSSFADYTLPATAVALKQGAGRLIRTEHDRGLLVVGDVRLSRQSYGRRLRAALPPMRVLSCEDEVNAWVTDLASNPSR